MSSNEEEGMANSVDSDQPDLTGAIWSESTLFVQACLSENKIIAVSRVLLHMIVLVWRSQNMLQITLLFIKRKPAFGVVHRG